MKPAPNDGEPYSPALISKLLRAMPMERLSTVEPADFHRWPTRRIVPSATIRDLVSNELSRRRRSA